MEAEDGSRRWDETQLRDLCEYINVLAQTEARRAERRLMEAIRMAAHPRPKGGG